MPSSITVLHSTSKKNGRPRTGSIRERPSRKGTTYALRLTVDGCQVHRTLGSEDDGWTREAAERALAQALKDSEDGQWPPEVKLPRRWKVAATLRNLASRVEGGQGGWNA